MDKPPAILVVDDETVNRSIAATVLAAAGWRVDEAESGAAAIRAVLGGGYALVLMDINMPDMDGFEATAAIRAGDDGTATVPILAFTALPPETMIDRLKPARMDGLISKPFTGEGLIAAVEPWRPSVDISSTRRLAAIFGQAEIATLLDRFRQQLGEALVLLDSDGEQRVRAHQIAGVAGTLGFEEVSRTWLALAEGDETSRDAARIAARKALTQVSPDMASLRGG